jgi:hypothetical protein
MLDEEPLFTPLTIKKIAENAQKSKEWKPQVGSRKYGTSVPIWKYCGFLISEVNGAGSTDREFLAKYVDCQNLILKFSMLNRRSFRSQWI